jgi:formate dehydrogenase (coenzyme F420) beta subunit
MQKRLAPLTNFAGTRSIGRRRRPLIDLEKLRDIARDTVSRDDIKYLVGWRPGTFGFRVSPHFVRKPEDAEKLIFSPLCTNNLATYLTLAERIPVPRGEQPDTRKVALMVKGCDSRAVVQQLVEQGVNKESVFVIGCPCEGVIDVKKVEEKYPDITEQVEARWENGKISFFLPGGKVEVAREEILAENCLTCRYPNPVIADISVCEEVEVRGDKDFTDVKNLESKSTKDKWAFWQDKFSSCIRCYSCRNVCPMCYCEDCILDKSNPTWISRSVNISENTVFQLARAFHLAGRCVECGECERVCPVNIPLVKLNRKLAKEVLDNFNYEPGLDTETKPLLVGYRPDDKEDFIL